MCLSNKVCEYRKVTVGRTNSYSPTGMIATLLTIIMSSERQPEANRIRKIAGIFKGKSSLLPQAPTPSSIEMDSSTDNPTKWATICFSPIFHWNLNSIVLLSISPLNIVPVVGVDYTDITATITKAYTQAPGIPISASDSLARSMSVVPKQLGFTGGRGLDIPPTVSDCAMLLIVVANYWSFSICLPPLALYRPRRLMSQCRYPWNQNEISLWAV